MNDKSDHTIIEHSTLIFLNITKGVNVFAFKNLFWAPKALLEMYYVEN